MSKQYRKGAWPHIGDRDGDRDVQLAIAIQIRSDQPYGKTTNWITADSPKGSISISQQDREVFGFGVCRDQIDLSISIEIARDHGAYKLANGEALRLLECPVAIVQVNEDLIWLTTTLCGYGKVHLMVAIKISRDGCCRIDTRRPRNCKVVELVRRILCQGNSRNPQQDTHWHDEFFHVPASFLVR